MERNYVPVALQLLNVVNAQLLWLNVQSALHIFISMALKLANHVESINLHHLQILWLYVLDVKRQIVQHARLMDLDVLHAMLISDLVKVYALLVVNSIHHQEEKVHVLVHLHQVLLQIIHVGLRLLYLVLNSLILEVVQNVNLVLNCLKEDAFVEAH